MMNHYINPLLTTIKKWQADPGHNVTGLTDGIRIWWRIRSTARGNLEDLAIKTIGNHGEP